MIEVHITPDEIKEINDRGREFREKKAGTRTEYIATKFCNEIGDTGEKGFKKYLKHHGIKFVESDKKIERGYSDEWDFKVNGKTIDVKTSKKYPNEIVVNEMQLNKAIRKKIDLFVGVGYIRPDVVNILGYCKPSDLERDEDKDTDKQGEQGRIYSIPYDKLTKCKGDGDILF